MKICVDINSTDEMEKFLKFLKSISKDLSDCSEYKEQMFRD